MRSVLMVHTWLAKIIPRRILVRGGLVIVTIWLVLLMVNDKNWRPLKGKAAWTATAHPHPQHAQFAIDQNLNTAWSPGATVAAGMVLQVDIGAPVTLNGLVLRGDKGHPGYPEKWAVKTSLDGETWQTPEIRKHLVYRSLLLITTKPVRARYVQFIPTPNTASSSHQQPQDAVWRIDELELLQPIVPWQFARSTLLYGGVGTLVAWLILTLFFARLRSGDQRQTG